MRHLSTASPKFTSRLLAASLVAVWLLTTSGSECLGVGPQQDRPGGAAAKGAVDEGNLQPGPTVRKEIKAGELHVYKVDLDGRQLLRIDIEANGGTVTASIHDPAGRLLSEASRGPEVPVTEPLAVVSQRTGTYSLEIRGGGAATYELSVDELRPANELDERRVAAERAAARGAALQ